ncbi:4-hydroxy 2-oxovalerate aldolase [Actinopolyspora lacussalsi subsp. righensis]|uniref:4-hydroxy 2-oxovalerate aldolase n=1 Tax=Actinopolyspora righensis TaxID=995060 RepID=A0A1I7AK58_9ACTN|nr:hypothetical protein [Actinopolyspora righensis]SFT75318.1 4-hydroxy 2-oxovalerate aldolase [Actinopolyspora righensis]
MSFINIDVTLRDGGYRNGFAFPLDYALEHARLSVESGFDWVEIAYRNGSFKPIPNIGLTGRGENEYIRSMAREIGPEHVAIILHPKNITAADLTEMYAAGARLVRIIVPPDEPEPGLRHVRRAREIGFTVGVNFARVSQLSARRLADLAAACADAAADVVYLADSNGSLSPMEAAELVTLTRSITGGDVGLHAHNNLGLALSNAIAAADHGAVWMDSSIQGMGKGPGNLIAEQWLAHLDRSSPGTCSHLQLAPALELAELLLAKVPEATPSLSVPDLVLGRYDLPVEHRRNILGDAREGLVKARGLAAAS